jgi:hypothetical protein
VSDHKRAAKSIQLTLFAFCTSLLLAGVASAGVVGTDFRPPHDFDGLGGSDVLLMKQAGASPNPRINYTQIVSAGAFTTRGWPDLNTAAGGVEYTTMGAGVFDNNSSEQSQILTRQTAGTNLGLYRLVKLNAAGNGPASPSQFFVGGIPPNYAYAGTGDFDDDGADDILSFDSGTGLLRIDFFNPVADSFTVIDTQFPATLPGTANPVPFAVLDVTGNGQADIWVVDDDGIISLLYTSATVRTGGLSTVNAGFFAVPTDYTIRDVGFMNQGDLRADVVFEKTANADQGVVRYEVTDGSASATSGAVFPVLLSGLFRDGEHLHAVGDFNGTGREDLLTRLSTPSTPANLGALTVRLMNPAGTLTLDMLPGSAFSPTWGAPASYDVIRTVTNVPPNPVP